MNKVNYKGYVIRPTPKSLVNGGWNGDMNVVLDKGHEIAEKFFFAETIFATPQEAIAHCIEFGKRVIDGEVPNCTVEDL